MWLCIGSRNVALSPETLFFFLSFFFPPFSPAAPSSGILNLVSHRYNIDIHRCVYMSNELVETSTHPRRLIA